MRYEEVMTRGTPQIGGKLVALSVHVFCASVSGDTCG